MKPLDNREIDLVCREWENDPKASATIKLVAASLRELQRIRAGIPKRITSWSQVWYEGSGGPMDSPIEGWNACVDAMEKVMK